MKKDPVGVMKSLVKNAAEPLHSTGRPTRQEAEEAVRTLLRWAGDNPNPGRPA